MAEDQTQRMTHRRWAQTYRWLDGWTCFHCGESFTGNLAGQKAAQQHFGGAVDAIPGCRLRMRKGEHSLLRRIRWLEGELRELRARVASEDTDKDRELHAMAADHAQAVIREEEKGYARGIRDARMESAAHIERLETAINRYLADDFHCNGGAIELFEEALERSV